jgi:hypothetical protein
VVRFALAGGLAMAVAALMTGCPNLSNLDGQGAMPDGQSLSETGPSAVDGQPDITSGMDGSGPGDASRDTQTVSDAGHESGSADACACPSPTTCTEGVCQIPAGEPCGTPLDISSGLEFAGSICPGDAGYPLEFDCDLSVATGFFSLVAPAPNGYVVSLATSGKVYLQSVDTFCNPQGLCFYANNATLKQPLAEYAVFALAADAGITSCVDYTLQATR